MRILPSHIEERVVKTAEYIVVNNATVRQAAAEYGYSKSSVHHDVTNRLRTVDFDLYYDVRKVLEKNKEERHIRGGNATRKKYLSAKGISL